MQQDFYADAVVDNKGADKTVPKAWSRNLYRAGVVSVLKVPHFGRSPSITKCTQF